MTGRGLPVGARHLRGGAGISFPPGVFERRAMSVNGSSDQQIECRDCGQEFIWSAGEQAFFQVRQLSPPKRCAECRKWHRESRAARESASVSSIRAVRPFRDGSAATRGGTSGYRSDCGRPVGDRRSHQPLRMIEGLSRDGERHWCEPRQHRISAYCVDVRGRFFEKRIAFERVLQHYGSARAPSHVLGEDSKSAVLASGPGDASYSSAH